LEIFVYPENLSVMACSLLASRNLNGCNLGPSFPLDLDGWLFCDLERCSIQPVRTQVPQLRAGGCAE
jgi:hypothetical protein